MDGLQREGARVLRISGLSLPCPLRRPSPPLQKHSTFTDADELIGMVYDCAYSGLRNREEEMGELSVD